MRKIGLFASLVMGIMLFTSCGKVDNESFVGTWGIEKLEYYNLDYAGNPIPGSLETYVYNPDSTDNCIQMIFRKDRSGEMRDSAIDTIIKKDENGAIEVIVCPDTVLVTKFTYSYDKSDASLYLNIGYDTYRMFIVNMNNNSFVYENEWEENSVEKAYLTRISDKPATKTSNPTKSNNRRPVAHPHKPGSFIGGR